jgi:proline racemase
MRFKKIISAVDTHTEGEPARVVVGGVPIIPGATFLDKWKWARENLDDLRKLLMFEPRGSSVMSGSIITAPVTPGADIGVIFIEVSGFLPMCGHGTIATCTALVETGIVPPVEPFTYITLDTPAGLVKAKIQVEDGIAKNVTIQNVPSFIYKSELWVEVPELGKVQLDIAYGGNFYAIVDAPALNLELVPRCAKQIVHYGQLIRDAIFEQVEVVHPLIPTINRCTHVRFVSPSPTPQVGTRNAVLYGAEAIDRSPCGTGTCAEMATRYAKGLLKLGEEFVSESIIGSLFYGTLVEETKAGPFTAVVPTIRGRSWVSGIQQFVLDDRDPFPTGFYLGESSRWGAEF